MNARNQHIHNPNLIYNTLYTHKHRHKPPNQRPKESTNQKDTKNKYHGGQHIKELINTQISTSGRYRAIRWNQKI